MIWGEKLGKALSTIAGAVTRWLRQVIDRVRAAAPERLLLMVLAAVAVVVWLWVAAAWPRPLEVIAFAVGDGDALLIRAPSGKTVLIDGGSHEQPNIGDRVLVPNLMLAGVHRLDAIMISHPDDDHINGLAAVLRALPVGMVLDPEIPCDGTDYQHVLATARERGVPLYRARAGGVVDLGDGTVLRVLAPGPSLIADRDFTNVNCTAVMLEYRQARMLFMGDLQGAGEAALLARRPDLRADVLKVAHHGSVHGSSDAFLDAVRPRIAIISCQGGSVHPHPVLLERLRAHGVQIWRTDAGGRLRLTSDGHDWQVSMYRAE